MLRSAFTENGEQNPVKQTEITINLHIHVDITSPLFDPCTTLSSSGRILEMDHPKYARTCDSDSSLPLVDRR
jgi:hypothetical protein